MAKKTQEEKLREQQKLKELSPYSLPDNPSQKGWSSGQIKSKMYQGLFYLYELFAGYREDVEGSIVGVMVEENIITFTKADGTTESFEIGSGNATIYYDDTLPEDASKLKDGDIWFDENN